MYTQGSYNSDKAMTTVQNVWKSNLITIAAHENKTGELNDYLFFLLKLIRTKQVADVYENWKNSVELTRRLPHREKNSAH